MFVRIEHDANAPSAAMELAIAHPLPDYDLDRVEAAQPRDVDPILASQGFHDLLDEARAILAAAAPQAGLEIVQITGAICSRDGVHRPGLWIVLREAGALPDRPISAEAQAKVASLAEQLRQQLQLS